MRKSTARRRKRPLPAETDRPSLPLIRGATGPRAELGKVISRRNAIRHGLLAHTTLLDTKNSDLPLAGSEQFVRILRDYLRRFRPDGPAELHQIEIAASALWRYRRALEMELGQMGHADMETRNDLTSIAKHLEEMLKALELEDMVDFDEEPGLMPTWMANLADEKENGPLLDDSADEIEKKRERRLKRRREAEETQAKETEERKQRKAVRAVKMDTLRKLAKILEQASPHSFLGDELERLERYESHLLRTYYRAMAELERLQRLRLGDMVPAPIVGYLHK